MAAELSVVLPCSLQGLDVKDGHSYYFWEILHQILLVSRNLRTNGTELLIAVNNAARWVWAQRLRFFLSMTENYFFFTHKVNFVSPLCKSFVQNLCSKHQLCARNCSWVPRTQEHHWTKESKPLPSWRLHSTAEGPIFKEEVNVLTREDNKCWEKQKTGQNKKERRCQGQESGGGGCEFR